VKKPRLPFMGASISQALRDAAEWNKVYMKHPQLRPTTTADDPKIASEGHSPIGFSGWDRHSACPGSVALSTLVPGCGPSSAAADEGTLAHAVAAEWLMRGHSTAGADKTMEDYVRSYVYSVWRSLPKKHTPGKNHLFMIESRVAAPSIHKDCRGTVDALIWDDVESVLQVHDLKYGKWPVSAYMNVQLMGYAMCAIESHKLQPKRVELYIHQVRLDANPDKWECDPLDVEMFRDDVVDTVAQIEAQKKILKKTKDPMKLTLNAGGHCRYCPAKLICHERKEAARREGIDVLMPVPAKLPKESGALVRFALKALPFARSVLKAAMGHLRKGGKIEGVKLITGKRVRVPVDPEALDDELTTEVGLGGIGLTEEDLVTTPKPKRKTLAQIAALVPKARKKAFDQLWKWAPGAPKLVPSEADGDEYKISADDYFGVIEDKSGEEEDGATDEDV
jgi:hypothetical protein